MPFLTLSSAILRNDYGAPIIIQNVRRGGKGPKSANSSFCSFAVWARSIYSFFPNKNENVIYFCVIQFKFQISTTILDKKGYLTERGRSKFLSRSYRRRRLVHHRSALLHLRRNWGWSGPVLSSFGRPAGLLRRVPRPVKIVIKYYLQLSCRCTVYQRRPGCST